MEMFRKSYNFLDVLNIETGSTEYNLSVNYVTYYKNYINTPSFLLLKFVCKNELTKIKKNYKKIELIH